MAANKSQGTYYTGLLVGATILSPAFMNGRAVRESCWWWSVQLLWSGASSGCTASSRSRKDPVEGIVGGNETGRRRLQPAGMDHNAFRNAYHSKHRRPHCSCIGGNRGKPVWTHCHFAGGL